MTHLHVLPETTLQYGDLRAVLAPGAGGRVTRLVSGSTASGPEIDWLCPLDAGVRASGFESTAWPKAGLYPLVPFSNRIQEGRLPGPGAGMQLPLHPGEAHALHGGSQQQPWSLTTHAEHSATMAYTHARRSQGWGWAYRAQNTVTLVPQGLTLRLQVTNIDEVPMPCGAGFHPYFPVRFAHRLSFAARMVWPPDAQFLGTAPRPIGAADNYAAPRNLPDSELTQYYSEWDGSVSLAAPDGSNIRMTASGPLQHLVLYRPAGREFFCVEPVSHVSNAANLERQGHTGTGWQTLAPGQTLDCSLRIQLSAVPLQAVPPTQLRT